MKHTRLCVTLAVLVTCPLPGRSGDDKIADQPKREITATRRDDGSIAFRFAFPALERDREFSGAELVRWKKGTTMPDLAIRIPLKATLDTEKRVHTVSFTLTKEMIDLDLAISTMHRSKQGGAGEVQRLAEIRVRPAKKE